MQIYINFFNKNFIFGIESALKGPVQAFFPPQNKTDIFLADEGSPPPLSGSDMSAKNISFFRRLPLGILCMVKFKE